MVLTLEVSDDLAARLRRHQAELPSILELGLREVTARDQAGFKGLAEVLETLATLPAAEEILSLRPSPAFEERLQALLEKSRTSGLSDDEEVEWERFQYLEHLVRVAKAKALARVRKDDRQRS